MKRVDAPEVIDAQIHLHEPHCSRYPWNEAVLTDPAYAALRTRFSAYIASPPVVLEVLDAHGVSGALVVTPGIYGFDNTYSIDAYRLDAQRFRVVGLIDDRREDVEAVLAGWASDPAYVGLRLSFWADDALERFHAGAADRLLAAAQRHGLCVCANAKGDFTVFEQIARRFPDLQVVIDHLGLFTTAMLDRSVRDTFVRIAELLALAKYENIAVKVSSVPLLSREEYPFRDVWPHLHAIVAAFGVERLMWGSDAFVFDDHYAQAIDFLRDTNELGSREKEMILGGTLRRIWRWPLHTDATLVR